MGPRDFYLRRMRGYGLEPYCEPFTFEQLIERDGEVCAKCRFVGAEMHLHHHVAVALGGAHILENVAWVCDLCNQSRNAAERAEVKRRRAEGLWPYGPGLSGIDDRERPLRAPQPGLGRG